MKTPTRPPVGKVEIREVDRTHRADVRRFVDLAERLHGHSPQWSPTALRRDLIRQVDGTHPFHRHSRATCFTAVCGGVVVGRIAAIDNERFNQHHGSNVGFFGLFDCIDDQDVAGQLIAACRRWLAKRGLTEVIGPRGMSGTDGTVMISGFEHPTALGVPWNPPYVPALIEGSGLHPYLDFHSGWLPAHPFRDERLHRIAQRAQQRGGYSIKGFTSRRELRRWIPRVIPVFLESMSSTATFYPPTYDELRESIDALLLIAEPRGVKLVLKEDAVVGFILTYPDLADALRRCRGRLFPLGWWYLLHGRSHEKRFVVNGVGVLPQHRGVGANAMLYVGATPDLLEEVGISRAEIAQVASTNRRSMEDMKALDVTWYKTHRLYRSTEET